MVDRRCPDLSLEGPSGPLPIMQRYVIIPDISIAHDGYRLLLKYPQNRNEHIALFSPSFSVAFPCINKTLFVPTYETTNADTEYNIIKHAKMINATAVMVRETLFKTVSSFIIHPLDAIIAATIDMPT